MQDDPKKTNDKATSKRPIKSRAALSEYRSTRYPIKGESVINSRLLTIFLIESTVALLDDGILLLI